MLVRLYNDNPNQKEIDKIVEMLRDGAVIIFPTDTIYGIGCDITKSKAVERIARIKNVKPGTVDLSFILHDLSQISNYCRPFPNNIFKLLKKNLPGPFTFLLQANSNVPKLFKNSKKNIGIRIPDNNILRMIVKELGNPVLSTSVHHDDVVLEYITDPELIEEKYGNQVDLVIDGGYGDNHPSTIVDCTTGEAEILRQGKGILLE